MNRIKIILIMLLTAVSIYSQDITGTWNGILKVQGTQLRLVFNVLKTDSGYSATIDSPDQGAIGLPTSSVEFNDFVIIIKAAQLGIEYRGKLEKADRIVGTFNQAGHSFNLDLMREMPEKEVILRPQEPVKPYPYIEENVKFKSDEDKIELAGTLTLPRKGSNFPVVILISGSGPQNRDEEFMEHKPFLVLSDYLTRKGIAVLRYDDRGTAESTGKFNTATSLDFAKDVEAAVSFVKSQKEISKNKIGLIGHSEGGLIAPLVASESQDVSFIVLLAGPGFSGDQILLQQNELVSKASGISDSLINAQSENTRGAYDIVIQSDNNDSLKSKLTSYIERLLEYSKAEVPSGMSKKDFINLEIAQLTRPWMKFFLKYDPAATLKKVNCPVLALNGAKDVQISPENLKVIQNALNEGGNKNVTAKEFPNLNHLFQECHTGLMNEYAGIEQTISPVVLQEISGWILKQTE